MENRETLLKSISSLLDETIEEYDKLEKADTSHTNLKLQPDENGDMPKEAGQAGDDKLKPLKKKEEEEKDEKKDEDDKEMDKNKDEECDEDEKEEKDENPFAKKKKKMKKSEEEAAEEEFDRKLLKSLQRLGLIEEESDEKVAKSDEAGEKEEKIAKSDAKSDDKIEELKKSQDDRFEKITDSIGKLADRVEELAKRPAEGRRSVDGLRAIRKSEEDGATQEQVLDKGKVINELLDKQLAGDKRVNPHLITKCEMAKSPEELKSLVKDIIN